MAPQLTAMYFPCLRELLAWIICGKNSFPAPLSPVMSTARSIGAICRARVMARIKPGAFPMMPNRCLVCCTSAGIISLEIIRSTKIRKGERKGKRKAKFSHLIIPTLLLFYPKIAKIGGKWCLYVDLMLLFNLSQLIGLLPQEGSQLFGGAVLGQGFGRDEVAHRQVYGLVFFLEDLGGETHGAQLPAD